MAEIILLIIGASIVSAFVIFVVESSYLKTKDRELFHKYRVIKVTQQSGIINYKVKINGFLGLPFLYQTDYYTESLDNAIKYVDRKNKEYNN